MFKLTRVSPDNLKVETPFPVTFPVWDLFVFRNFPRFELPDQHAYKKDEANRSDMRVLIIGQDGNAQITDGEIPYFWIHARSPADGRTGLNQDVTGYICVPEIQASYLDFIEHRLQDNVDSRVYNLHEANRLQRDMLKILFEAYQAAIYTNPASAQAFKKVVEHEVLFGEEVKQKAENELGTEEYLHSIGAMCKEVRWQFVNTLEQVVTGLQPPKSFVFPQQEITDRMYGAYAHLFIDAPL